MGIGPVFRERPEYSTINARAETVTSSPTFREEMKRRRCLVPATGFYEWQKIGNKPKQPWTIELLNGEIFALAGLWDRWKDRATGSVLETYTIITTDPNELVQPMHDRMPVILSPSDYVGIHFLSKRIWTANPDLGKRVEQEGLTALADSTFLIKIGE